MYCYWYWSDVGWPFLEFLALLLSMELAWHEILQWIVCFAFFISRTLGVDYSQLWLYFN